MTADEINGLDVNDLVAYVSEAGGRVTVYRVVCREWRASLTFGRQRWTWLKPVSPTGPPEWQSDQWLTELAWERDVRAALTTRAAELECRLRAAQDQLKWFDTLEAR